MNAIARRVATPVPVLRLTNFAELVQFAQMAAKSSLVPPEYRGKPENIMIAVQLGSELGLAALQSVQNIAVIGSRPTVWGDAMLALVLAHPDCLDVIESVENGTAVCTVKRRGRTPVVRRFSVTDAKTAKLWGKAGPWTQYPDRMLQMRARGFALRDAFPDVLKGLITAEEARDTPVHNGPTFDGVAEPMPPAPTALTVVESVRTEPVRAAAASIAPAPVVRGDEWPDDSIPELDDFNAAPPSAASTPRNMRDEINEAVPMTATGGLPDLELPDAKDYTQHGTIDTSGRWKAWTAKVRDALGDTSSRAEVEAIACHPVVADATASGPAWVRRDLSAMLARHGLHADG